MVWRLAQFAAEAVDFGQNGEAHVPHSFLTPGQNSLMSLTMSNRLEKLPFGYRIPQDDDALFNECQFSAFRASGAGGQHVNTTDSAVRLVHFPTGLVVQSSESRSQHRNREVCLKKLRHALVAAGRVRKKRVTSYSTTL